MRRQYQGKIWEFKTFCLFPFLNRLLTPLDHVFRVVFPIAYLIYVLIAMSEVNYGIDQREKLDNSWCYTSTYGS